MKNLTIVLLLLCSGGLFAQSNLKLSYQYKKSDVSNKNSQRIDSLLKIMKAESPNMDFVIVGHADSIGGPSYNDSLSQVRAEKVKAYMLKAGFTEDQISIKALGLSVPLTSNDTEEGRDRNRRVEIFFEDLNKIAAQRFELFEEDTTLIKTNSGCVFTINANDLLTPTGEEVTDTVVLFIKEYNTPIDFMVGKIPMENKHKRIFYDSYSMFDIRVFQDSSQLVLKEGASYAVECPIRDTDKKINLYEFNKYSGDWDDLSNIRNVAKNKAEVYVKGNESNELSASSEEGGEPTAVGNDQKKSLKTTPAVLLSDVKLNTDKKSSSRKIKLEKWKLLEDVQKLGSPNCSDSLNSCNSSFSIGQLATHKFDSVWYNQPNDTLRARGIDISYRMNKYFKSAVFKFNVNEKFYDGSQYVNGFEWRHKIKGMSSAEFDERMNKNWTDIKFYGSEKTKEFRVVLKYDGGSEELLMRKRFMKEGFFETVKPTGADVYSKELYADDYCFWKENWKYMSDAELRMPFQQWMRVAAQEQEKLNDKYAYLAGKTDSLNNEWCNVGDNSKADVKPIEKGSKVELFGFALINFDAEIPTTEFLNMEIKFEDLSKNEITPDTVYQVMKGLNSLRTFVPLDSVKTYKIKDNNDTYFFVKAKNGKRYLSSIERFTASGEAVVKMRDVTKATETEKGLRTELNIYFPEKEWILAASSSID